MRPSRQEGEAFALRSMPRASMSFIRCPKTAPDRHLLPVHKPQTAQDISGGDGLPWDLFVRPGAEQVERWDLFENAPLFGLPDLPDDIGWPNEPYNNLEYFQREHARIFFGRGRPIRELFNLLTLPAGAAESGSSFITARPAWGRPRCWRLACCRGSRPCSSPAIANDPPRMGCWRAISCAEV